MVSPWLAHGWADSEQCGGGRKACPPAAGRLTERMSLRPASFQSSLNSGSSAWGLGCGGGCGWAPLGAPGSSAGAGATMVSDADAAGGAMLRRRGVETDLIWGRAGSAWAASRWPRWARRRHWGAEGPAHATRPTIALE